MSDTPRRPAPPTEIERAELTRLWQTLRGGTPRPTRRDLMRWSAISAGALATARLGHRVTLAGPSGGGRPAAQRFQDGEVQTDVEISVPFDAYGQPVTLDPHRSADYGGFWVMFPNVWNGLLRYDENGAVQADLAESFDVSDDGLVYTARVRPDARYANGRPVVADHFIASWRRALNPSDPSPLAGFMQHVQGYPDFLAGNSDEIGFRAVDDATLEITLSQPVSFFPSYMAAFVWSVVDPQVLEEVGEEEFFLNNAGTGPWRFTEFEPDVRFVMEPNPEHFGGISPSLARIVWPILTGPSAASDALTRYRSDEAVSADVPLSLKAEVEGDQTLAQEMRTIEPAGTTRSLAMDFNQAPFDDVRVRRAFAHAIDRERYASEIYAGTWTPTTSFTPPIIQQLDAYQPPEGLTFDPDEARGLLEQAGYPNGEGLPEIVMYLPSSESQEEIDRTQRFLDMFNENLGVTVTLDTSRSLEEINDLQGDNGGRQFDLIWWQTVTQTPHLLSEVFRPDSPNMDGVFNWREDLEPTEGFDPGADARQFVELVDQADQERDQATRADLYRQAEDLVLRNAVYVPIANWRPMYVQKPWLQGTRQGPWTGRLPVRFDQQVVVSGRP